MGLTGRASAFTAVPGAAVIGVLLLFAVRPARAGALELTFTQKTGRETVVYRETLRPSGAGCEATVESPRESNSVVLDSSRATLSWRITVPSEGMDITARRQGDLLIVSGRCKGEPYEQTVKAGADPWYQFQELSLDGLAASDEKARFFWTIDRRTLKPVRFRAERRQEETITMLGRSVRAVRFDMTIAGVPAVLFRARFWLRASDGRYLRLEVPGFLGQDADSVVELTREEAAPDDRSGRPG
jgi:hypothetical protein